MRECRESEIKLSDFLKCVHEYTTVVDVVIVGGWFNEKIVKDFKLSEDVFGVCNRTLDRTFAEYNRLLKYYADVPVWNISTHLRTYYFISCGSAIPVITCRAHYSDIAEAYEQEKADIKKEKRREYRQRAKNESR